MRALVVVGLVAACGSGATPAAPAAVPAPPAAPQPVHGIAHITIGYTYSSFHEDAKSYTIAWTNGAYRAGSRVIDTALVEGLYASLSDLRPSDRDLSCTSHFDDYPKYRVMLAGDDAWNASIELASTSNCHDNAPWNVTRDGKRYAQFTGTAGRALRKLLAGVDPDSWRAGPDVPDATCCGGTEEPVLLDELDSAKATSPAALCAHDLETSPRAQAFFDGSPKVSELLLLCDLAKSRDCTATFASAKLVWSGLDATVEIPCNGGRIEVTPELDALHELVASKPVRALVKQSRSRPQLRQAQDEWILDGDVGAGLEVPVGQAVIHVRANGNPGAPRFWQALGLDGRKLTRKDESGYFTTEASLGLDGKLAP
jgi:hypothetical protein